MKKFFSVLLVAIIAVATVFAQGGSEAKDGVEISLMHFATREGGRTDIRAKAVNELLDKWVAEHPDVTLEVSELAHDDYQVKIQAMAAAGELPSVYMLKGPWIDTFKNNDLLDDISDDIKAYEHYDDWFDGIFRIATRGDEIYGVPYEANTSTCYVYYNKQLWKDAGYDEFPTTWEEMFEANEYFKSIGVPMIGLGNKDKWPLGSCVLSTLGDRFTGSQWTQDIIANNGKAKFTDPEFVAALTLIDDLRKAGAFNVDANMISNNVTQSLFMEGKYACEIEGSWALSAILAEATPEMIENIGIAKLPMPEGGKGNPNAASGGAGWFYAIADGLSEEERAAALDLVFSLVGIEYAEKVSGEGKEPSPFAVDYGDVSSLPQVKQDFLTLTAGYDIIPVYDVWMSPVVIDAMNTSCQEMLNGMKTPAQVAETIQKAYEK